MHVRHSFCRPCLVLCTGMREGEKRKSMSLLVFVVVTSLPSDHILCEILLCELHVNAVILICIVR